MTKYDESLSQMAVPHGVRLAGVGITVRVEIYIILIVTMQVP